MTRTCVKKDMFNNKQTRKELRLLKFTALFMAIKFCERAY